MKDSVLSVSYNDTGNNAIEDNECTCCRRNQSRVKTFQTITVRCIVVCAVLTISNVLFNYTVWNKLNTLSSENEELRSRNVDLQRSIETIISLTQSKVDHGTHSTSDVQTSEDEDVLPPLQRLFLHRNKRDTKNNRRRNRKKRCKNCLPVVQIEGAGGFSKQDKTDITGFWKTSNWSNSPAKYFDTKKVNQNGKLKVVKDGLYLLYAQMNLRGTTITGMEIFKQESSMPNTRTKPSLECIAMTLTGQYKRGYYIKKEPGRTSIASCFNFSNGDSITDSNSCPTMAVVPLKSGDNIYIEEITTNTSVNYSQITAVLGLIRVGN
ncbi:hypothetical protein ACF0H5_021110 [Mactra antiquata]